MRYPLLANPRKNYYTTRKKDIGLIVIHVTAGLQDLDMSGEDLTAAKTNQYGATTSRRASWHAVVDSDSIEDSLPDGYTAFRSEERRVGKECRSRGAP